MTQPSPFDFTNRAGERLDHTYTAGDPGDTRIVVVGHGVTSHKERPWLVTLCDRLAEDGVASVRITFSGNPGSGGSFEEASLTKCVGDLRSVVDAIGPRRRVVYAGHSMGGAVGVLAAVADPRIRALVSLAGMVDVKGFFDRLFGDHAFGAPMLGKEHCPWNRGLRDDADRIGSTLAAGAAVACPWLLVHGTDDELVPNDDSRAILHAARARPALKELEGADHRFAGQEGAMADAVCTWLSRALPR